MDPPPAKAASVTGQRSTEVTGVSSTLEGLGVAGFSEGQGKPGMFRKIRHHRAREEGVAELCVPLPLAHCTIVTFLTLGP